MNIMSQWLECKKPELRAKSVEAYGYCIDIVQKYLRQKRIKFSALQPQDVQLFVSWLFARGYAHKTVRLCMGVVRMTLGYIELMDTRGRFSADKIMRRVKLPREKKRIPVCMTREECANVLTYLKQKNSYVHIVALMAYLTGMRVGEILALKIKDVDMVSKTVFIGSHQKNGNENHIPLITHPDLIKYIDYRKTLKVDHDYMFIGQGLQPMGIHTVQKAIRRASIDTGINFHMHTFRHSIASHLAKAKTPLPSIQKLLRHSDIKTTMIYVNFFDDDVRDDIVTMHPLANVSEKTEAVK